MKKVIFALLIITAIFLLTSLFEKELLISVFTQHTESKSKPTILCEDNNSEYEGDYYKDNSIGISSNVKLYGKYKENIAGNYVHINDDSSNDLEKQLKEGTKIIRDNIDKVDLTGYRLYYYPEQDIVKYYKENDDNLWITAKTMIKENPINIQISYYIEERDGRYMYDGIEKEVLYSNYFPEPIISVGFSQRYITSSNGETYLKQYYDDLYFTKDGELVGERGDWLIEGVDIKTRNEYAQKYLNKAQELLGVEQTKIKYSAPYTSKQKDYIQKITIRDNLTDMKLYGKYKKNIPNNHVLPDNENLQRQLSEGTKIIRDNIYKVDLTGYSVYYRPQEDIVKYYKENDKHLHIETYIMRDKELVDVEISYDVAIRNEKVNKKSEIISENYFPQPIITIKFMKSGMWGKWFDYLYFTKDGELVGEIKDWGDWYKYDEANLQKRDEYVKKYAKKYLNKVQELLAIEQTEIKYDKPYPQYVTEDIMQKN